MSWRVTLLEARLPRHAQNLSAVLPNKKRSSDASLGRTRGPLVGRRRSASSIPHGPLFTVTIRLGHFIRQQNPIMIHSSLILHLLESTESTGLQTPELRRIAHLWYSMTFTRLSGGHPLGSSFERIHADAIKHEHARLLDYRLH